MLLSIARNLTVIASRLKGIIEGVNELREAESFLTNAKRKGRTKLELKAFELWGNGKSYKEVGRLLGYSAAYARTLALNGQKTARKLQELEALLNSINA